MSGRLSYTNSQEQQQQKQTMPFEAYRNFFRNFKQTYDHKTSRFISIERFKDPNKQIISDQLKLRLLNEKDKEWYQKLRSWFSRRIMDKGQQTLNKAAFGQDIDNQWPWVKTKAMKIQKIFGFIRFISRLLQSGIKQKKQKQPKRLILSDYYDNYDGQNEFFEITYSDTTISIRLKKRYKKTTYELEFRTDHQGGSDQIRPFSAYNESVQRMLSDPKTDAGIDKIYSEIIYMSSRILPTYDQRFPTGAYH